MSQERKTYIPALRYDWLTPFYDLFMRWTMRDHTLKRRFTGQARLEGRYHVLDLGCGTATLALVIKSRHPEAEVVGLDGDTKILGMARAKIAKAGLQICLVQGTAFEVPFADCSFDRVLSSLVIHHLTRENKIRTFREAFRILRPGGELHIADFGKPNNALMYLISWIMRKLEETSDNVKGLLPQMLRDAGFAPVEELARHMTMFGTVSFYRGRKPGF